MGKTVPSSRRQSQLPPPFFSLLCTSSSLAYKAPPHDLLLFIGCLEQTKLKGPKETNLGVPEKATGQYPSLSEGSANLSFTKQQLPVGILNPEFLYTRTIS